MAGPVLLWWCDCLRRGGLAHAFNVILTVASGLPSPCRAQPSALSRSSGKQRFRFSLLSPALLFPPPLPPSPSANCQGSTWIPQRPPITVSARVCFATGMRTETVGFLPKMTFPRLHLPGPHSLEPHFHGWSLISPERSRVLWLLG